MVTLFYGAWVRVVAIAAAVCGPVTPEEWDAACRRAEWEPGEEQART